MILAVVDDLIFLTRIQETAQHLKLALEVASPAHAEERVRRGPATAILVDLNHRSGGVVQLIERIKSDPGAARIPVVGFLSHVQAEVATAARAAGCDIVLARSAFVKQLPQLLMRLSGGGIQESHRRPDPQGAT